MSRLWALLEHDHDTIRRTLDDLTGDHGGPQPDAGTQRRLARRLVAVQSAHELAEERVLWPTVRRLCEDGDSLATTALAQEHRLKRALNELAHISPGGQEFTQCVNTVAGLDRTHLSYEQTQVWPRLQDRLTAHSWHGDGSGPAAVPPPVPILTSPPTQRRWLCWVPARR